jgi:hypothetical protein
VTGVGEVFIQITLRQCSPLLRQQEVETQMHADQQGYTQIPAVPTLAHVQASAVRAGHLRASLLICVHLRFPLPTAGGAGAGMSKECQADIRRRNFLRRAPDRSAGTHRVLATVPMRRRIAPTVHPSALGRGSIPSQEA